MLSRGWMVSVKSLTVSQHFLEPKHPVTISKTLVVALTFFHQVDTAGISSFFFFIRFFSSFQSMLVSFFTGKKKKKENLLPESRHQEYKKKNDDVYLHTSMQVYFLQTHFSSRNYPSILPKHNCCFWIFLSKKYLRQISG